VKISTGTAASQPKYLLGQICPITLCLQQQHRYVMLDFSLWHKNGTVSVMAQFFNIRLERVKEKFDFTRI
jgi:hypothetical protein